MDIPSYRRTGALRRNPISCILYILYIILLKMGGVFFSPKTGAGDLRAAGLCIGYFIACYLSIVFVFVL